MGVKEAQKELGEIVRLISEIDRIRLGGKIKDNRFCMDVFVGDLPEYAFTRREGKHLHLSIVKNEPSVEGYVYFGKRERGKYDLHLSLACSIIKAVESLVPEGEIKTLDLNGYKVEICYFRSLLKL